MIAQKPRQLRYRDWPFGRCARTQAAVHPVSTDAQDYPTRHHKAGQRGPGAGEREAAAPQWARYTAEQRGKEPTAEYALRKAVCLVHSVLEV